MRKATGLNIQNLYYKWLYNKPTHNNNIYIRHDHIGLLLS